MTFASREKRPPQSVPRDEYPRPQFVRDEWMCLNGIWEFEIDRDDDGELRGLHHKSLSDSIVVPFAPESQLSGLEATGFLESVWYRRTVSVPQLWSDRRVLLHFQASDHDTTVWVNGTVAGRHRGGFTPFSFDITDAIADDRSATIVVRARDRNDIPQARGKQSRRLDNYEAFYTRTTGIWQTVWLEPVNSVHFDRPRITPEFRRRQFSFEVPVSNARAHTKVSVTVSDSAGVVVTCRASVINGVATCASGAIPLERFVPWSPENPHLYDITFVLENDGEALDRFESYAGLRTVSIEGQAVLLNGAPFFQKLVLDQGWYPEGLMTAPSDAALVTDIELALDAGFNGARLHQKVFEERFLYHADRLGYLVWGEFADWGIRESGQQRPPANFVTQWIEVLERDYSHPSIVGWCPLNETFEPMSGEITALDDVTQAMYSVTKAIDHTRPVVDSSGYSHRVIRTDIYDSHNYEQDPHRFRDQMDGLKSGAPYVNTAEDGTAWSVPYSGQPYFCSEFGGIWWSTTEEANATSWGYGQAPATIEQWYERASGLFDALASNPKMFGYCFTQLTDVFQEKNGLFTFDRKAKFDLSRLRAMQSKR